MEKSKIEQYLDIIVKLELLEKFFIHLKKPDHLAIPILEQQQMIVKSFFYPYNYFLCTIL